MVHTRSGYNFRIETGAFRHPVGRLTHYAMVAHAVRHGFPAEDLSISQLPFRPLEHWGEDETDAIANAVKQIDDWFDAHPSAGSE